MSLHRPDLYEFLDSMALSDKEALLEYLQAMIKAEKNAPLKSHLEEQWSEIRRLMKSLDFEPYIDDQIEIDEIWEICEELIKDGALKEEAWPLRKKYFLK